MLFSVTIPAYKSAFLRECINSVLSQTYTDFELIIVNDASPYDLDSIVNCYSDTRIRYYKNEKNFGAGNVVDNWNKCLEYATGDYIICMGDDDLLLPNCLEEYSNLINKYPGLGIYHAWTQIIDEDGKFVNITAARPEFESAYSLLWHRWNNRQQQFIGDFLFDTRLLKTNGGFFKLPLAWGSDDISAIIAATPYGIANTQNLCFCYRSSSHTISSTSCSTIKMKAIVMEKEWYHSFLQKEPEALLDIKYWKCIRQEISHHFNKKKGLTVAKDLKDNSVFRFLSWLNHRKEYGISMKSLLYALYTTLKKNDKR